MKDTAELVDVCKKVVSGRNEGRNPVEINGVFFNVTAKSMCSKFVRQSHQAVTGIEWPEWAGLYAVWTERQLFKLGYKVPSIVPGSIVCFNANVYREFGRDNVWAWSTSMIKNNKAYGHIAVALDSEMVAENTSSSRRGSPVAAGTKITPISSIGRERISGIYRVLPVDDVGPRPPSNYAEHAVDLCNQLGIMSDKDCHDPVKRQDLAVILADRLRIKDLLELLEHKDELIAILNSKRTRTAKKKDE